MWARDSTYREHACDSRLMLTKRCVEAGQDRSVSVRVKETAEFSDFLSCDSRRG